MGSIARAGKGALVLVASDASEHTWRRAMSFVAGTKQTCIRIPATKAEMGQAIGRQELAIAAITDPNMALAMVKALPGDRTEALEALTQKADRAEKASAGRKGPRPERPQKRRTYEEMILEVRVYEFSEVSFARGGVGFRRGPQGSDGDHLQVF